MGWLIAIVVVVAIIWFMIVSPGFRYTAIGLVLFAGAAIFFWIQKERNENEQRARERAASEAIAVILITKNDIALECFQLVKDYSWWGLKGNVINHSKYTLGSLQFLVRVRDCPETKPCIIVAEERATAQ